ncbi:MAG: cytochrome P450 [Acidimicrobiales bacterium]|nr:cytochrome P450 [Acidimicrobiales bacterium]
MAVDGLDLISPEYYGAAGPPWAQWRELRAQPLTRFEPEGYQPFWAVTRHADIVEISGRPDDFCNGEGIVLLTNEQARNAEESEFAGLMKTIIEMDPPDHRMFRKVASGYFTPRGIERLDEIVSTSAKAVIDALGPEGEADFVERITQQHPLRVLSTILGIEPDQEQKLLELTTQLFGGDDPELQREGEDRDEAMKALFMDFYLMFNEIIQDRRANPRDDLATMLATATLDNGEPLGDIETLGYYLIVFNAGHDTTRHSLTGAFQAFLDNPGELQRLRDDPSLMKTAVEEIVRYVAPVNYMKRTATRDLVYDGHQITKGDRFGLFYASANRDAEVFDDPDRFDIGRSPNRHLGFGWAEHYCLGAHLARASIAALLEQLAARMESMEPAGDPAYVASSFVVGPKHLPIRYKISS